ncbi:CIA30 family protein [Oculatella sp. LEGE 06141]|uniref:CIA30 family protein n=1 Tax=Oculatella sp. LEGE 06141 TaxID=1828648 RepID=UPI001880E56D|nr:CIA30 family protein [Oculatella sp. LEGE 06141]MBE9178241.1 CIA30 family protein [Oculatella sp. LEGE 06141]
MTQQNAGKWDLGRFVKTLSYFGAIPFLSSVDWFQQWFGSQPDPKADSSAIATTLAAATRESSNNQGVILVAGATGGVGKRVVQRLVAQGYSVRSLVREAERARSILGEAVPVVEADITLPETLTPEVMANVNALICCTGTRVQPVEGDTPTREKYYQGLKFYLPEVVDTPEYIEYQGIQNLVQALNSSVYSHPIFDFTQPSSGLQDIWGALDDVVMGGVSESGIHFSGSAAQFAGNVSTANSGGFASVRTRNFDRPINLAEYDGIELRVKGDGNRYKFMLRTETQWDGVAHSYSFDTIANQWMTVRIPFAALVAVFRAKSVSDRPLDPSQINAFQLMLSKFEYDGGLNPHFTPGAFHLEVASIRAYRHSQLPQFVMVSSAGVTRPGKPGLNLEDEPPAVRMNDQLGGILTWKLKGEEAVRHSGLPYTIIRPCALTEESGGQALIVAQGDTLKGKVSREDVAALCVAAIAHSEARNIVFEVAEGQGDCAPDDWRCLFLKSTSSSG